MKSIYLVAYHYQKPAHKRVKTQLSGWMNNPDNSNWDEKVAVTRTLKNRDITMGKIILDLWRKQIIRNGYNKSATFDDLFRYFNMGYPEHTKDIMLQIDPDYYYRLYPDQRPKTEPVKLQVPVDVGSEVRIIDTSGQ